MAELGGENCCGDDYIAEREGLFERSRGFCSAVCASQWRIKEIERKEVILRILGQLEIRNERPSTSIMRISPGEPKKVKKSGPFCLKDKTR